MSIIKAWGFAWYRRDDYDWFRENLVDGFALPSRFDDWEARAKKALAERKKLGHIVEPVYLDPDEFTAWCRAQGCDLDARARMHFAAMAVRDKKG